LGSLKTETNAGLVSFAFMKRFMTCEAYIISLMHLDRAQHTVWDIFDAKIDLIYKCKVKRIANSK
jgi:hypothetical protein